MTTTAGGETVTYGPELPEKVSGWTTELQIELEEQAYFLSVQLRAEEIRLVMEHPVTKEQQQFFLKGEEVLKYTTLFRLPVSCERFQVVLQHSLLSTMGFQARWSLSPHARLICLEIWANDSSMYELNFQPVEQTDAARVARMMQDFALQRQKLKADQEFAEAQIEALGKITLKLVEALAEAGQKIEELVAWKENVLDYVKQNQKVVGFMLDQKIQATEQDELINQQQATIRKLEQGMIAHEKTLVLLLAEVDKLRS